LLGTTDLDGAVTVAERARTEIADTPIGLAEEGVRITVSIGCASGPADAARLVRQAATALRQAKRAGKNRVVPAVCPEK
jgi:diguanylate cyclase (GGDEF)-like protein